MQPRQYGRIVNMSSLVYRGSPGQFSYSAAKGGIFSFTRSLAMAMGGHNITVNALAPALVDVPIFSRAPGKERWEKMVIIRWSEVVTQKGIWSFSFCFPVFKKL